MHKLLWEICKISKNIDIFYGNTEEVSKIMVFNILAEKQIFEIFTENLMVLVSSNKTLAELQKYKSKSKLKTVDDVRQVIKITLDVIILSLEVNPNYFKDFCNSEKEAILKYPTINFLY